MFVLFNRYKKMSKKELDNTITPDDIIRLKNIEKLAVVYIANFILPNNMVIKQNKNTGSIKGYLDK